jgi:hypothetical protein
MRYAGMRNFIKTWMSVAVLGLGGAALAHDNEIRTRVDLDTVPNSDISHPSGTIMGDEWSVDGYAGDVLTIQVDTRDDTGAGTSGLDPVVFVKRPDGTYYAFADDNVICSRAPVCGYQCPRLENITLDQSGRWIIIVRDFDSATGTEVQCTGGAYNLYVTGPYRVVRTLRIRKDDGAVSDPPTDKSSSPEYFKGSGR